MAIISAGNPLPTSPIVRMGGGGLSYHTLTGDTYSKVRQLCNPRYEAAFDHCKRKFELFYRVERIVEMITKKKSFDWKANIFLPFGFSISEQSAAMKYLALLMSRPYVTVEARPGSDQRIAERRQALIDYHLTADVNIAEVGLDMFRQTERYGKAVAMVTPTWNKSTLVYRDETELPTARGPIQRLMWQMRDESRYGIHVDLLDLTDFVPEPYKRRINPSPNGRDGMRYCFRTMVLALDELMAMEAEGEVGPQTGGESVERIRDTRHPQMNEFKARRQFLTRHADVDDYVDPYDRPVALREMFTYVPDAFFDSPDMAEQAQREEAAGLDPKKRVLLVANEDVVLQNIALPWHHGLWPFIEMDCVPDPHGFYGKGKIEPIEHAVYSANEVSNLRLDNVKQAVNGLIGVDGRNMPMGWKRRLVSQPWGVVETMGIPNQVLQRLQFGDVTASSYEEQSALYGLMQEASAINETLMGSNESGGVRTFGEHAMKAESASRRLQYELVGQANQLLGGVRGLARFIMGLDRQYLPIPTYLRVIRPDSPDEFTDLRVEPQDLREEDERYLYLPTGAVDGINRQAQRMQLAEMLNALSPFMPLILPAGFNVVEMTKMILRLFNHDPARFFPSGAAMQAPGVLSGPPAAMSPAGGLPPPGMAPAPGFPQGGPGAPPVPGAAAPGAGGPLPGMIPGQEPSPINPLAAALRGMHGIS